MASAEYRFARPSQTNASFVKMGIVGLTIVSAGCSADVARFDSPAFSLTGGASTNGPKPPEGTHSVASGGAGASNASPPASSYTPPRAYKESGVQVAALPEAQRPASTPPPAAAVTQPERRSPPAASASPAPQTASTRGEQIEVHQGDTLYGLSRKHHVSLNELMQVNGLQNPSLKPGQKLYLPVSRNGRGKPLIKPATDTASPVGASPAAAPVAAVDASGWTGTYTVKAGDSLYAVSRQHKVKMTDLQQVNGITDVRKVRPGTVLKVPAHAGAGPAVAAAPSQPASNQAASNQSAPRVAALPSPPPAAESAPAATATQPTLLNGTKVAALNDTANDASQSAPARAAAPEATEKVAAAAPAAASAGAEVASKLRWPVKGKVIAGFGPRPDGTHNDGVNLAVPQGTEVHAAEAGSVAYAGSELKGYGNLVLLRHDNGWVTAYAHNESLLVKRGDRVKRGQVIGKAGKSGQVDQPQVHFELRQGSKPVDPTQFMERL